MRECDAHDSHPAHRHACGAQDGADGSLSRLTSHIPCSSCPIPMQLSCGLPGRLLTLGCCFDQVGIKRATALTHVSCDGTE